MNTKKIAIVLGTIGYFALAFVIGSIPGWVRDARAQQVLNPGDAPSKHAVSSTLTRPANTTAYAGTATAPVAVCAATSVTVCAPLTLQVSTNLSVSGNLIAVSLVKGSTGATGATFRVLAYQGVPTLTSTFDTTAYTPLLADQTSGAFIGAWQCGTLQANSNNGFFECTPDRPSGNNAFNLADGTLRFVVEATGAYAPASGETFVVVADLLQSVR